MININLENIIISHEYFIYEIHDIFRIDEFSIINNIIFSLNLNM